jgi:hypothetical protein
MASRDETSTFLRLSAKRQQAPHVAGGVVIASGFIPVTNIALNPLVEYLMSPDELRDITRFNVIEAVLFSRLDGFIFPDRSASRPENAGHRRA